MLVAYLAAIVLGTALLMLPMSARNGETTSVVDALFTATSAVSVTGLAVVDTATHWTVAGQVIILLLIQVGGLGIMTLATLFALLFFRRLSLRARQAAAVETKSLSFEDFKGILRRILVFALLIQAIAAVVLVWRLASFHSESLFSATFNGIFLAISSFNNAGFAPYSRNLEHLIGDPWILFVISFAVILGGLGFPVVIELVRKWRTPRRWSILTRVTIVMTGWLLVLGTAAFWFAEHDHVATLASLGGLACIGGGIQRGLRGMSGRYSAESAFRVFVSADALSTPSATPFTAPAAPWPTTSTTSSRPCMRCFPPSCTAFFCCSSIVLSPSALRVARLITVARRAS